MTRKKAIKHLMSIGYSINDARSIVCYGNAHRMTNFDVAVSSYKIARELDLDPANYKRVLRG